MPRVQNEEAAHLPVRSTNGRRLVNLQAPVWDLAQLASGVKPEDWRVRRGMKHLDAAGRHAARWKEACNVMLRRWFDVKAGHIYDDVKADLSEWLRTKHETLSQALKAGEILQIDVLDAVVGSPSAPRQGKVLLSRRLD